MTGAARHEGAGVISLAPGTKVFLACRPINLRNGFGGLAAKAQQVIGEDPFSGHLFIFRGKRGDYFKGIYWDGTGMWLIAKRLEKCRFVWPPIVDGSMTLAPAQFAILVEAMDWRRTIAPPPPAQPMLVCPQVLFHDRVHKETRQLPVGVVAIHSLSGIGQAAGRATVGG